MGNSAGEAYPCGVKIIMDGKWPGTFAFGEAGFSHQKAKIISNIGMVLVQEKENSYAKR